MPEYEKISWEAHEIVDIFVRNNLYRLLYKDDEKTTKEFGEFLRSWGVNIDDESPNPSFDEFIVSLYALTPNADSSILQALDDYRIDLTRTLSNDQIDVLIREFKAVVRYCSDRDFLWWPSKNLSCMLPEKVIGLCHSVVRDYCSPIVEDWHHRLFDAQHVLSDYSDNSKTKIGICGDVLFPFADDVQFSHNLNGCLFDCYEPDPKFWAFSQILNDAYLRDIKIHSGSSCDDSGGKLYDYIFSCPAGRNDVRSVAAELYNLADTRLKEGGVMCCVLPESFCYAPEWYDLRKILIDKRGVFCSLVISLPDLMQPYVTGNMCMFCLVKPDRDRVFDGYGRITDSDGYVILDENGVTDDVERRKNFIDSRIDNVVLMNAKSNDFLNRVEDITDFMEAFDGEYYQGYFLTWFEFADQSMLAALSLKSEKYMWSGRTANLGDNVNLLPTHYLISQYSGYPSSGEERIKLGDIIEIVPLSDHASHKKDGITRRVDPGALSANYLNCSISCNGDLRILRNPDQYYSKTSECSRGDAGLALEKSFSYSPDRLTERCLLASYSNGRFKVGRVVDFSSSYSFELSPEIIPFRLRSDMVSEDFLLRSLLSDNVLKQSMMLCWGGFYNSIDKEDFLEIEIFVPSKEEQERLCREDVQQSLNESDRKLIEAFEKYRMEMHTISHSIGQTIFRYSNLWKELQDIRRENHGILRDDLIVDKDSQLTVGGIYDRLQNEISRLREQISKFDRGNGLKVENFAITLVIEEYINKHQNSVFEFRYDAEKHHRGGTRVDGETGQFDLNQKGWVLRKGDPIEYVRFPREALKMVLENIESNACSHGFVDPEAENIIQIELEDDGENVVVTVSNNGKPIDERYVKEVFIYGKSSDCKEGSHAGIGGWEIKHLMQEFGGDAEVVSIPSGEFTVSYRLTFPSGNFIL